MSFVLNNQKLINGINPKIAKKICIICNEHPRSSQEVASFLSITNTTATNWLIALAGAGYLTIQRSEDATILWFCSAKGYTTLATARFGKALSGDKFAKLLLAIINRVEEYNEDEYYPLHIDKVYIFGEFLVHPWHSEDPNIAITTSVKSSFKNKQQWRLNYWTKSAGDKHLSIVDQIYYPETELYRFLKKQKEHFNIYFQDISEISDERKLLYVRNSEESLDLNESVLTKKDIEELGKKIEVHQSAAHKRACIKSSRLLNEDIVDYWKDSKEFLGLSLSPDQAAVCCWRCGSKHDLQHCHIIPDALGGKYTESNLVLLCARCHAEGPNLADPRIMFDWITSYRKRFGNDFWNEAAIEEYNRIYNKDLYEEIKDILSSKEDATIDFDRALSELKLMAHEVSASATFHFGQPWLNNTTMAGCFRLAIEQLPDRLDDLC